MTAPRTPPARWDRELRMLFPPSMATSVVVMAVDTGSWAAAFAVPGVSAILGPGAAWTPEGLFVVVALTVQTTLGQARVLEGWGPHLAGPGRWAAASVVAAMVTAAAFGASTFNWATLGACALIALVARVAMVCAILLLRRPLLRWLAARSSRMAPSSLERSPVVLVRSSRSEVSASPARDGAQASCSQAEGRLTSALAEPTDARQQG